MSKREIIVWADVVTLEKDYFYWIKRPRGEMLEGGFIYKRKKDVDGPAKKIKITIED